jgi:hypothetical protein
LLQFRRPHCSPALDATVIALEAHEGQGSFSTRAIAALARLREPSSCCRVVLTTRLREPLAWYVSAWLWGGAPRFQRYGRTIETWAPVNMQSLLLLKGDQTPKWIDGLKRNWSQFFSYGVHEHNRSMALLEHDYDLAWPLERFDDGMRVLAWLLGLPARAIPLMVNQSRSSPSLGSHGRGALAGRANEGRVCSSSECRQLIAARAPYDASLHALVVARFAESFAAYEREAQSAGKEADKARRWAHACACSRMRREAPGDECRCMTGGQAQAALRLTTLPNSTTAPNLQLCGVGATPLGSDSQVAVLHDALNQLFGAKSSDVRRGRRPSGLACYLGAKEHTMRPDPP